MNLDPNFDVFGPDVVCWEKGQHGGRTRPINRDVLFQNLCELHEVLNQFKITHWLSHGTMLGVYREGNFIAWDDDIDLGLYFSQREAIKPALEELKRRGFYIPPSDPFKPIDKNNAPYYDLVAIKNGEKIEGWFFEKIGQEYIYDLPRCGRDLAHPAWYYDKLATFNFKGVKFNIPNHVEDYLVMMYGETWKTPDESKKYNRQW